MSHGGLSCSTVIIQPKLCIGLILIGEVGRRQEIGEISLGDDTQDTPMEFSCTFSFSDWTVGTGELSDPASGAKATKNSIA